MSLLPNLRNRRMSIILEHETNEIYFKYLWVIILNAHSQGTEISLFDCDWDNYEYTNMNHHKNRLTETSRMRDSFLNALCVSTNGAVKIIKVNTNEIQIAKNKIKEIRNFSIADEIHPQFGNSLRSVFARDYLSSSNLNLQGRKMKKKFRVYVQSYLSMQALCQKILSTGSYDLFLIANGRYPTQTAMRVTAEELSLEYIFYEHGMPKGKSIHLAPFQTQEFLKMQEFIKFQIKDELERNREEVFSTADKWLENQENSLEQNPFIVKDSRLSWPSSSLDEKPLAVIFNSSIDEKFSNMGVNLNGWESQKQATVEITNRLRKQEFEVLVRIHPNTANKSWWDLVNLVSHLKSNKIEFVLPWNGPSSYSLIQKARIVLTWGSTISMESIARGIPTVVYGRTMYDEIAGAKILNPNTLNSCDFRKIEKPNPSSGKIAAYFNKNWGYRLTEYCSAEDMKTIDSLLNRGTNISASLSSKVLAKFPNLYVISKRFEGLRFWLNRLSRGRYSTPNDLRLFLGHFLPMTLVNKVANFVLFICLRFRTFRVDGEVSI